LHSLRAHRSTAFRRHHDDTDAPEGTVEVNSLKDLYIDQLKDLYDAENQILKALPKMVKAASDRELQRAFTQHEKITQRQVQRLERIFKDLEHSPRGKKCVGMQGLIEEAQELIKETDDADTLDAGLIAKAQHVEHYEMAGYGTVRTYAQHLGLERHAQLLQETLDEEGEADKRLTQLAESSINIEAQQPDREVAIEGRGARTRGAGRAGRRVTAGRPSSRTATTR
jgi:ferritin-like metal-binding protein YciE